MIGLRSIEVVPPSYLCYIGMIPGPELIQVMSFEGLLSRFLNDWFIKQLKMWGIGMLVLSLTIC